MKDIEQQRVSHEVEYQIKGADMQYVEIELDPGETAISEPGSMMYMEQGVQMKTGLGDGSDKHKGFLGSLKGVGKRMISGEGAFMCFFTNNGSRKHRVAFAGNYLGQIQAIDLKNTSGEVYCQRGSFLCGAKGVAVEFGFSRKVGFGLFGGEGFVMQKLTGDGLVFIHASGSIEQKYLEPGETVFIDTGSLVGFEMGMDFDIETVKGISNMLFSGEDIFLTTIRGPGNVWIQSMPYYRMVHQVTNGVLNVLADRRG